jgi:hypothetical protein
VFTQAKGSGTPMDILMEVCNSFQVPGEPLVEPYLHDTPTKQRQMNRLLWQIGIRATPTG